MISFSTAEILLSVLYAIGYGILFSTLNSLALTLKGLSSTIPGLVCATVRYDRILSSVGARDTMTSKETGPVHKFLSITLFTLGLVIVSFLSLDGLVRGYMLIISFAAFYLSNITICAFLRGLFGRIISLLLDVICVLCRLILLPLRVLVMLFLTKKK